MIFLNLSLHSGCCLCRPPISHQKESICLQTLWALFGQVTSVLLGCCQNSPLAPPGTGGLPSAVVSPYLPVPQGWGPLPRSSSHSRGSLSPLYDHPFPSHTVCPLFSHGTLVLPCLWLVLHSIFYLEVFLYRSPFIYILFSKLL